MSLLLNWSPEESEATGSEDQNSRHSNVKPATNWVHPVPIHTLQGNHGTRWDWGGRELREQSLFCAAALLLQCYCCRCDMLMILVSGVPVQSTDVATVQYAGLCKNSILTTHMLKMCDLGRHCMVFASMNQPETDVNIEMATECCGPF